MTKRKTQSLQVTGWGVNGRTAKLEPAYYTCFHSGDRVQLTLLKDKRSGAKDSMRISMTQKELYELISSLSVEQSSFTIKWHGE